MNVHNPFVPMEKKIITYSKGYRLPVFNSSSVRQATIIKQNKTNNGIVIKGRYRLNSSISDSFSISSFLKNDKGKRNTAQKKKEATQIKKISSAISREPSCPCILNFSYSKRYPSKSPTSPAAIAAKSVVINSLILFMMFCVIS